MGIAEIVFGVSLVAFVVYAHSRRPRPGDPGWHPLGYTRGRPFTAWELTYVLSGSVLLIWLLRVAQVLYVGSD